MKQKQKSEMEELGAPVEESKGERSNGTNGVRTRRGKGQKSRGLAHENKTRDKRAPRDRFSRTGRPAGTPYVRFCAGRFWPPPLAEPAAPDGWLQQCCSCSLLAHLACTAGAHAPRRGGSGREVRCSTAHALLPLLLLQGAATTQWSDGVVVVAGAGRAHREWTVHKEKRKEKQERPENHALECRQEPAVSHRIRKKYVHVYRKS